ncbi:MAG: hypothetical protein GQ569_10165 [Methylococcaceae bacterium]|nr:hypothetical protein [Methylococcaceae bacterium]
MSLIKYALMAAAIGFVLLMLSPPTPLYFFISSIVNYRDNSREISPEKLTRLLSKADKILLVDVRSVDEYQLEHISGAISIPFNEIEQHIDKIKILSKNRRLITYCSTGPRSFDALSTLERYDIEGSNLSGGFDAWWDFTHPN